MASYKTIKLASEAGIPGIEFVKRDGSVYEVVIGDLRIASDYGLRVMVLQPFESISRKRVTATIEGFGTKVSYFEDYSAARDAERDLKATGATVTVDDVKVKIDDAGNVVADHAESASAVVADETVPF